MRKLEKKYKNTTFKVHRFLWWVRVKNLQALWRLRSMVEGGGPSVLTMKEIWSYSLEPAADVHCHHGVTIAT